MSTVAIVMATYNGEKYVAEQMDSILASSYQDFELFVFDDGSKDNTIAILREYEQENPSKIHVYQNKVNLGLTANFLQGLCKTTMDYIMFCDQDDYWKPNKIAITLKRMRHMEAQTSKEIPMVAFTDAIVVDQDLCVIEESFFRSSQLNPRKTDLPHILMENKLIGCTVMLNGALRKVIQSYRLPLKARYHDWWVALIAASMGKICFINEGTLLYRQHGGNVVGEVGFFKYLQSRITAPHNQKEVLVMLMNQAEELLELYGDLISAENQRIIRCFADLNKANYIKRRMLLLQYGFFKTGIIRNVGLMFLI